ncbi:hypothetical protein POX_a00180 [Penicillium oxalicum]|uniref:Uncharacterized protein n=1 Tax=Penicillium oxalicum (strain 114-2 / CGMCC 5302) TaxID=933388 RepID=S8B7E2_PENO1|nr:hypothetical protein POX_a00180 [Penicillium oxalicum]EPS34853.1 hypothetical protein PDE_09817 [Penicillium oxalicum 114-2]KAI2793599.1 hypothetical protein POX_a00180 [Penicillium oxalicum]
MSLSSSACHVIYHDAESRGWDGVFEKKHCQQKASAPCKALKGHGQNRTQHILDAEYYTGSLSSMAVPVIHLLTSFSPFSLFHACSSQDPSAQVFLTCHLFSARPHLYYGAQNTTSCVSA